LRSSKAPPREGKKMDEDEVSFLQPKEEKKKGVEEEFGLVEVRQSKKNI
jgi:hypothetical protein